MRFRHLFLLVLFVSALSWKVTSYASVIGKPQYERLVHGNKVGLIDNGEVIIPAKYEDVGWTNGQLSFAGEVIGYKKNGYWGLISIKNKIITAPIYNSLIPFGNKIIASRIGRVSKTLFYGLMNDSGASILPFSHLGMTKIQDLLVTRQSYEQKNVFSAINGNGEEVISSKQNPIVDIGDNKLAVFEPEGTTIFDKLGTELGTYYLDSIGKFGDGFAKIYKNNKVGVLNSNGAQVIPPNYKAILRRNGSFNVLPFTQWGIIDTNNSMVAKVEYDSIVPVTTNSYWVAVNGHSWVIDSLEQPLTQTNNELVERPQGSSMRIKIDGKYGLANTSGNILLKPVFDSLVYNGSEFALVEKMRKGQMVWSVYDTFGIKKSNFYYQEIQPYSNHMFAIKRRDKWGFMDRTGNEKIHCIYDSLGKIVDNRLAVKFHNQYGIINNKGQWEIFPQANRLQPINKNLYMEQGGNQTLIKNYEDEIVYFTSNQIEVSKGGFTEYRESDTISVSFEGTFISEQQFPFNEPKYFNERKYNSTLPASEGLMAIEIDGMFGFVDKDNNLRIANRYEKVKPFASGLAAVKIRDKWGFINHDEQIVIQPHFTSVGTIQEGLIVVEKNGLKGLIDINGKPILKPICQNLNKTISGRILYSIDGNWGMLNQNGTQAITAKYEFLQEENQKIIITKRKGKYGAVNAAGVQIIPEIYEQLSFNKSTSQFFSVLKKDWISWSEK